MKYAIKNMATGKYFCADWCMNRTLYANMDWSSDSDGALEFESREEAKEVLNADPFPSRCKIVPKPTNGVIEIDVDTTLINVVN